MEKFGLKALVINSDTSTVARASYRNLWDEARTQPNMLLLSPEELQNPLCSKLLDESSEFYKRVCMLGVDELHLLYQWGRRFRKAFSQIGNIRARLPLIRGRPISVITVTATFRKGPTMDGASKILELVPGRYHLIRRSNMRNDIQLIFRRMISGLGSSSFPELYWVLESAKITVIFCTTISLGFRVSAYLWRLAQRSKKKDLSSRLRLYNSLNWPDFNQVTMGFLEDNPSASITIATDTHSIGWDSRYTQDAIILGEPDNVDDFVQKIGRIGRDRKAVQNPRAFLYYSGSALDVAKQIVQDSKGHTTATDSTQDKMDISTAQLLLADCKMKCLDDLYENPSEDMECRCRNCQVDPPPRNPVVTFSFFPLVARG